MNTEAQPAAKTALSERELNVVRGYSNGISAVEIAGNEGISVRTVEAIIGRLRYKFDCRTTTHLVATFFRNKIIE